MHAMIDWLGRASVDWWKRIIIFLSFLIILYPIIFLAGHPGTIAAALLVILLLASGLTEALRANHKWHAFGLHADRFTRLYLLISIAILVLQFGFIFGVAYIFGAKPGLTGRRADSYFLNVIVLIFLWAAIEEVIFRGIVFQALLERFNPYLIILLSAVFFSVSHLLNQGTGFLALTNVFLAGIFFGLAYYTTKSLLMTIYYHVLWNAGTQLLFSSPVSGFDFEIGLIRLDFNAISDKYIWIFSGPFGIEQGLITTLTFLILIIVLPVYFKSNPFIESLNFHRRFIESKIQAEKLIGASK